MSDNDITIPGIGKDFPTDLAPTAFKRSKRKKDDQLQAGDRLLGHYQVLGPLGKGGMGIVYRCQDTVSGIEVAVKTLSPELSASGYEMYEIKENFQLVHKLHHPNIANYNTLEQDAATGNYYLIMEYVEGEELRFFLHRARKEKFFDESLVIKIVQQIAEALDFAHKKKILHRDIKPANIMITRDGQVKLLDFGLAAQIHSTLTRVTKRKADTTSGTIPYMAPEQWRGYDAEEASDQYALAATVYEMFAKHPPFDNPDREIMRSCVLNDQPQPLKNVSPAIQNAVLRALSKNPEERFENCKAFSAALSGRKTVQIQVSEKGRPLSQEERIACYGISFELEEMFARTPEYPPAFQNQYHLLKEEFEQLRERKQDSVLLEELQKISESLDRLKNTVQAHKAVEQLREKIQLLESDLSKENIPLDSECSKLKRLSEKAFRDNDNAVALHFFGQLEQKEATLLAQGITEKKRLYQLLVNELSAYKNLETARLRDVLSSKMNSRKKESEKAQPETAKTEKKSTRKNSSASTESTAKQKAAGTTGQKSHTVSKTKKAAGVEYSQNGEVLLQCSGNPKKVLIPKGVKKIDNWAFSDCYNLSEVIIPASVEHIGAGAFARCTNLTKIMIPDSVKKIGDSAFYGCSRLTEASLPGDTNLQIGKEAFPEYCKITRRTNACCGVIVLVSIIVAVIIMFNGC